MAKIDQYLNLQFFKANKINIDLADAVWIKNLNNMMFPKINNIEYKNFLVSKNLLLKTTWQK
jgi:hypothetical protein